MDSLTDEELHAIENLILLCPKHHKIVDDHPEEYSADRLWKIKADHESRAAQTPTPVLHRLIEALAPEVPDNWWERPGAPVFRLHLASSRPQSGQWTFEIGLEQLDGGDIGKLRFGYSLGGSISDLKAPTLSTRRKWKLDSISFQPHGQPFEFHLSFWWEGAERRVVYHWNKESSFQERDCDVRYY